MKPFTLPDVKCLPAPPGVVPTSVGLHLVLPALEPVPHECASPLLVLDPRCCSAGLCSSRQQIPEGASTVQLLLLYEHNSEVWAGKWHMESLLKPPSHL